MRGTNGRGERAGVGVRARARGLAAGLLLMLAAVAGPAPALAQSAPLPEPLATLDRMLTERMVGADGMAAMARPDGWTYTIDVAMVMREAALRGQRDLYGTLRDDIVRRVVVDDPADPYTRGFVAWRWRPDQPLDASGTTEAIRVAEALWIGAAVFDRPEDRRLALLLIDGYLRHESVDHGVWLVRNYFNFGTRAFATNAFMLGFAPDFLADVARATGDARLAEAAQKSSAIVARAARPSGLVHELVQPEIETAFPGMDLTLYSPNGVVNLLNSCTVVEQAVVTWPDLAPRLVAFAAFRLDGLSVLYDIRTGTAVGTARAGVAILACLARLADRVGDLNARQAFLGALVRAVQTETARGIPIDWFAAAETWWTLGQLRR